MSVRGSDVTIQLVACGFNIGETVETGTLDICLGLGGPAARVCAACLALSQMALEVRVNEIELPATLTPNHWLNLRLCGSHSLNFCTWQRPSWTMQASDVAFQMSEALKDHTARYVASAGQLVGAQPELRDVARVPPEPIKAIHRLDELPTSSTARNAAAAPASPPRHALSAPAAAAGRCRRAPRPPR